MSKGSFIKKSFFYSVGGQALKHISQRVNEISIFGDIQHSTGHGPVQPALTGPSPNGVGLGV